MSLSSPNKTRQKYNFCELFTVDSEEWLYSFFWFAGGGVHTGTWGLHTGTLSHWNHSRESHLHLGKNRPDRWALSQPQPGILATPELLGVFRSCLLLFPWLPMQPGWEESFCLLIPLVLFRGSGLCVRVRERWGNVSLCLPTSSDCMA
jgi:hypothetical protein